MCSFKLIGNSLIASCVVASNVLKMHNKNVYENDSLNILMKYTEKLPKRHLVNVLGTCVYIIAN